MLSSRRRLIVNRTSRIGRKLTFERHYGYEKRKLFEAYLFWLFLGRVAGHWFYMRRYVVAVVYAVTMVCLFGVAMIFPQLSAWILLVFILIKIVELFLIPRWVRSSNIIIREKLIEEFDLSEEDWLDEDVEGSKREFKSVEGREMEIKP